MLLPHFGLEILAFQTMIILLLVDQLLLLLFKFMLLETLPLQLLALLIEQGILVIHLPDQLQKALLLSLPAL